MTERLDEYPNFGEEEPLPWEPDYESLTICPFSNMKSFGKPLESLTSTQLLAVRREAERRNGKLGTYFQPLIEQVEAVLRERGGVCD